MALQNKTIDFRTEGIRFANFNQTFDTGIALTTATQTTFNALAPAILLVNNDIGAAFASSATETGMKQVYLDQLWLKIVSAGTGLTTGLEVAVIIDNANRFSSGGTNISANSTETDIRDAKGSPAGSISLVYLAPVATAAVAPRIVGRAVLDTAAPTAGEQYLLDFGSLAGMPSGLARASSWPLPVLTIGPAQSVLIYIWGAGMTAAPTFEYGLIFIED